MKTARPDNRRGNTSPELRGRGNPPTPDEDEANRLLEDLAGDDDDELDERNKKPKGHVKKKSQSSSQADHES